MNHRSSLLTGILGILVGIWLGFLAANNRPPTGPVVRHAAIRGLDQVTRDQISLGVVDNFFDCRKLVPLLTSSDNLDTSATTNPCAYRVRSDYAGPAYLRVVLLDNTDHARVVATWRGMAK